MNDSVIQIKNLVKEYKGSDGTIVRAVNNVSMSVAAGEIVKMIAQDELVVPRNFKGNVPTSSRE